VKALPVMLHLADARALLVGGGGPAVAKARLLLAAGAEVTVVADAPVAEFYDWAYEGVLTLHRRGFEPDDLAPATLVIAATDDEGENLRVSAAAHGRNIPVNVVDEPGLSSFTLPAIVDRDSVVVAISTSGAAPALARWIRARVERVLPARVHDLARFAERHRGDVRTAFADSPARRRFWDRVFDGPIAEAVLNGDEALAERLFLGALNQPAATGRDAGHVAIVGAGPGDADLLTLRAHRLLQAADVVVHDRLVGPRVLDLARRDARRIDVGKRSGAHPWPQSAINDLLVELARGGARVVRLKGGDPFVFGRGGEELDHLARHGIRAVIVPGITAAMGCVARAGFPLTQRDVATTVTFVSGRAKAGGLDLDWPALAKRRQTLVVYMGVATAAELSAGLIGHGRDPATPVAVIENGTRPDERVCHGRLAELPGLIAANAVTPPALIVIGEVVRLGAATALAVAAE